MNKKQYYFLRLVIPLIVFTISFIIEKPMNYAFFGFALGYLWCWMFGLNYLKKEKNNG